MFWEEVKDDPSIEKCDVFFEDIIGMKLEDSRTIRISFTCVLPSLSA